MELRVANIFADTSGWAELLDPTQQYHTMATNLFQEVQRQRRKLVTTNYIITELVALLTRPLRHSRLKIIEFIQDLKLSAHVEIIHIDPTLDTQAWQLLTERPDKTWSLVDCSSFVVMQQRNIIAALTTDHHFEQAGFVSLLSHR